MKAYTDIEQSRKLAEILPLESADMYYFAIIRDYPYSQGKIKTIAKIMDCSFSSDYDTPCWSLAALLSILPIVYINNKKEVCGPLHIDITDSETPFVLWYVNLFHKGNIVEIQTKEYDNLVDACYEMITKLHEQKLL